jgi:DNA polymerase III epsilon subunit-like protein
MFLFFDTETTGLPKNWNASVEELDNWPRLVQIAWLVYNQDERKTEEKEHIIKPEGFLIPAQSTSVHGITTEKALKEGDSLHEVLAEFADAIDQADFLIAHNMSFDEKIVGAEFLRSGMKSRLFEKERICTMISSIDFCRIPSQSGQGYKWPKLSELHVTLFGKDFDGAHDAFVDTTACAECFFELRKRKAINIMPVKKVEARLLGQGSLF